MFQLSAPLRALDQSLTPWLKFSFILHHSRVFDCVGPAANHWLHRIYCSIERHWNSLVIATPLLICLMLWMIYYYCHQVALTHLSHKIKTSIWCWINLSVTWIICYFLLKTGESLWPLNRQFGSFVVAHTAQLHVIFETVMSVFYFPHGWNMSMSSCS